MKNTKNKKNSYKTVSKGVQQLPNGKYRARRVIGGTYYDSTFTNLTKAKAFYKNPLV